MPLTQRPDFKQALSTLHRLQREAEEDPQLLSYSNKGQQWAHSSSSTWWNWQGSWWTPCPSESHEGDAPSIERMEWPIECSFLKDSSGARLSWIQLLGYKWINRLQLTAIYCNRRVQTQHLKWPVFAVQVCSKLLQDRSDDQIIQSDYKCTIGLKVQKWEFSNWLCLRGDVARLHDRHQWQHDHQDWLPHRAHQHEHLSVCALSCSSCVSASSYIAHAPHWLESELCPSFHSHPHALMMCAVLPRHRSLHSLHPLPLAPPVALLPPRWGS